MLSESSQATKNAYCVIPFIEHSRKCKLTCSDRKQLSGCLGILGARRAHKRAQENLEDGGYVHCLDGNDGFMGAYLRPNSSNRAVIVCPLYLHKLKNQIPALPLTGCSNVGGSPHSSKPHSEQPHRDDSEDSVTSC